MGSILVVDDEVHLQKMVEIILKKSGHKVFSVSSGEEALAFLKEVKDEDKPDLMFLDIMLDGMDGLQLLQHLQASESTKYISVIMMTAISHQTVVLKGIKLGAKGYLKKPFHPKELSARVSQFLG